MKTRKFKTCVFMESVEQADGTRKAFKPGDIIEERYITPESIDQYINGGLLEELKDGSSSRSSEKTDNLI